MKLRHFIIMLGVAVAVALASCGGSKSVAKGGSKKPLPPSRTKVAVKSKGSGTLSGSSSSASYSAMSAKLGVKVTASDNKKLYSEAASWMGTPYKYGGTSRSGVDCSGFVHLMYKSVYSKTISRQSAAILENDCQRISRQSLRAGDLVFFRTDGKKSKVPNHVGIYLKDDKFIHASSSKGVVVSSLSTNYYVQNWITGGRVK